MTTSPPHIDRRTLLQSLAILSAAAATRGYSQPAQLPPHSPGELDIHHIDTGRGNCTLLIAPDGTTFMIDAGASTGAEATSSTPRPDSSRRPGEWQARYAQRHARVDHLDYLIATHIHPDHVGDLNEATPLAPSGAFRLTGVSDVDYLLPVTTHIDRDFPDFAGTPPAKAPYAANYLTYLNHRIATGRVVQSASAGSLHQLQANKPTRYPTFNVRILAANGNIWTGQGESATTHLPPSSPTSPPNDQPTENILSIALRFSYGPFSYFSGGDLNHDTHDGAQPWRDIESPVVRVAGRTEVAAADHHGYFDACGPEFVHKLDAQAYIIQAWDIGHPGSAQVQRMLGAWNAAPTHDVFSTDILPANEVINRRFVPLLKSRRGHVVVRVAPGGSTYRIFVLDSTTEAAPIATTFGPYYCRPLQTQAESITSSTGAARLFPLIGAIRA